MNRFKLDENLDPRLAAALAEQGCDTDTVYAEGLSGAADDVIYRECMGAGRALITLDLDFSNPFLFPPKDAPGIVVLRPPRPVLPMIRTTLRSVLPELISQDLAGRLWIVEPERIRVYDPEEHTSSP